VEATENVRVLVVGRDPLARAGLVALMSEQTTFDVCGQAGDDTAVAAALEATRPDAIIWDLGRDTEAELDGLADATAGPPVLALLASPERAAAALGAGARGVLLRGEVHASHLEAAIHALVEGLFVLDPLLISTLRVAADRHTESPIEPLTPREEEVLQRLAEGLSNKMIAQRLEISEHTVKFHINAILGKLGAESRTEAVARAARLGLITF
jgi:DNA-binding NarL/FixJ family response regulator